MPLRGATGALTFELSSRWYWLLVAAGLAGYWGAVVAISAVGIESSGGRWLLFVAALMAVNGLLGTNRLIARHVRRVVLDGSTLTVVTVSETREIPVSSITRIDRTPPFARRSGFMLSFDGGVEALYNNVFTRDRPVDVARALVQLRPDIRTSGRWSSPGP